MGLSSPPDRTFNPSVCLPEQVRFLQVLEKESKSMCSPGSHAVSMFNPRHRTRYLLATRIGTVRSQCLDNFMEVGKGYLLQGTEELFKGYVGPVHADWMAVGL